ncbi:MAG: tyrosine-type recombinase/integrase [Azospirillaceae bacterium]
MADTRKQGAESSARRGRHPVNRLTAVQVRNAPPGRHADGNGLYLEVDESGARRWLLRTVVHGRRRHIGLGSAALVPLSEAREKARSLRAIAREGGDPVAERDKHRRQSMTFEEAARTVHAEQVEPHARNAKHRAQWISTLETYAYPTIGKTPVHAVQQADVLRILAPIWMTKPETARRVRQRIRTVLDWARASGLRDGPNPVENVETGLPKQPTGIDRNFAAYPWADLPALMPRIEAVDGMGALALRFAILTAARSGEVRGVTWDEIDTDAKVWAIPASRMKGGRAHRVPLTHAALAILEAAQARTGSRQGLVFPSSRPGKPLSDMTLSAVLRRLQVPATVHGFRSTFRDWASERTSASHEVMEAALAHVIPSKVERAYRRGDVFDKRRTLMEQWAAYALGTGGKVVELRA